MFALRVDVDCRYGLVHGVPNILELLRKNDLKASFYVVMGGETGLLELLASRRSGKTNEPLRGVKLPPLEIARILLFPKNFAEENVELLRRVRGEGHSLGVHAWKHREWTRALDLIDVRDRMRRCTEKYRELFGRKPEGFVAPGFKTNEKVLKALDDFGFRFAGDLDGDYAFHPAFRGKKFRHVQIPVTLKAASTAPLMEDYSLRGFSDEKVAAKTISDIKLKTENSKLATMYVHDLFEGAYKPRVLGEVLKYVARNEECATIEELGRKAGRLREVKEEEFFAP